MSVGGKTVKKYFKQLMSEVHPDYFLKWPSLKHKNEEAIHTLRCLLELTDSTKVKPFQPLSKKLLDPSASVEFYCKSSLSATDVTPDPVCSTLNVADIDLERILIECQPSSRAGVIKNYYSYLILKICVDAKVSVAQADLEPFEDWFNNISGPKAFEFVEQRNLRQEFLTGIKKALLSDPYFSRLRPKSDSRVSENKYTFGFPIKGRK